MAKKTRERQHDELKAAAIAEGGRYCREHGIEFDKVVYIPAKVAKPFDALVYIHFGKNAQTLLVKLGDPDEEEPDGTSEPDEERENVFGAELERIEKLDKLSDEAEQADVDEAA